MNGSGAYDLSDPQTWGVSAYALEHIRPYQIEGVRFLSRPIDELRKSGGYNVRGVILGDQMGLGKTAQAAMAAQIMTPPQGTIVIACPPTVVRNWRREIRKWVGHDQAIHVVKKGNDKIPPEARWVICSYDRLHRLRNEILARAPFSLIGDEGIKIKGNDAQRTKYFAALAQHVDVRTGCRVHIINGTPIANRISDLIAPLQILGHKIVEDVEWFKNRYCWSGLNEAGRATFNGARNVDELRAKLDGIYIQRLRKDVASDLPPMNRRMVEVEPEASLFRNYKDALAEHRATLRNGNDGQILAVVGQLKKMTARAKMGAAADVVQEMMEKAPAEKIVVFSYYPEVLEALAEHFNAQADGCAVVVHGAHSQAKRDATIERFQNDATARLFFGQIEAAGVGPTLTAANHVVFADLDWRAFIHMQAEDRVNRLGQERDVTVTYLHAPGTIDDHLIDGLARKLNDSNAFERRQAEGNAFRNMLLEETKMSDQRDHVPMLRAIAKALSVPREREITRQMERKSA